MEMLHLLLFQNLGHIVSTSIEPFDGPNKIVLQISPQGLNITPYDASTKPQTAF